MACRACGHRPLAKSQLWAGAGRPCTHAGRQLQGRQVLATGQLAALGEACTLQGVGGCWLLDTQEGAQQNAQSKLQPWQVLHCPSQLQQG